MTKAISLLASRFTKSAREYGIIKIKIRFTSLIFSEKNQENLPFTCSTLSREDSSITTNNASTRTACNLHLFVPSNTTDGLSRHCASNLGWKLLSPCTQTGEKLQGDHAIHHCRLVLIVSLSPRLAAAGWKLSILQTFHSRHCTIIYNLPWQPGAWQPCPSIYCQCQPSPKMVRLAIQCCEHAVETCYKLLHY